MPNYSDHRVAWQESLSHACMHMFTHTYMYIQALLLQIYHWVMSLHCRRWRCSWSGRHSSLATVSIVSGFLGIYVNLMLGENGFIHVEQKVARRVQWSSIHEAEGQGKGVLCWWHGMHARMPIACTRTACMQHACMAYGLAIALHLHHMQSCNRSPTAF